MKPDSRYSLAEHKVDTVLETLRGRSQGILLPENDRLLKGALDDLADAMEELRAAHEEVDAQRKELDEACRKVQREHQRYLELFEDAPEGYIVTDLHGVIEQANLAAAELFDSARDFIVGKPLALFVNKEDKEAFFHRLNEMDTLEAVRDWELRFQPWKGEPFWASVNIAKAQVSENEDISLRWLIRDISNRKKSEELLRRYALLAKHGRDIILFMRRDDGRILEANAAAIKAYGYGYENLLTMTIHDLRAPDTRMLTIGQMAEAENGGILFETVHRRSDGSVFPVEVSSRGQTFEGARTLISVIRDITDRKRTENLVKVRLNLLEFATSHSVEELLQKILDEICALLNSPIGFLHFVENDQKTLLLQAWSTRTVEEFCSAEGKGAHYPIDKAGVWVDCFHEKCPVIHNDYSTLPHRKGLPDGHPHVIRELSVPIIRANRVVAILGIGNKPENYTQEDVEVASYLADMAWEITRRKLAEEELEEAYKKLNAVFESITDGFLAVDREWRVTYLNKAGAELFGMEREDVVGGVLWELFPDAASLEFYSRYHYAAESNSAVHFEEYYPSPLNKWWQCHAYPSSDGLSVYFRDITERKLIEDTQVFLAQCGRIASGEDFFESLARYLGQSLGMDFVCIDRLEGDLLSARTLAIYFDGKFEDNVTYTLRDTPCSEVVGKKICCFPKGVRHLFPNDVVLQEMKAESYVGTILWGSRGQAIGLIAVIGRQPLANRRLAESMLQLVAVRAAGELERKWAEESLREYQSRLDLALRSAQMGVWDLDLIENKRRYDDQVCHILGTDPAKFTGTAEEFFKAVHPDDREMINAALARTIEQGVPYETEYRAVWPDGSVHYITARAKLLCNEIGQPVRINGLIWDITERKHMQEELRKSHDELELRVKERTAELHQAGKRLRSLASELLNSGENERKLIAQEIHDGLSSQLAAIKFCLEREMGADRDAAPSGESIRQTCTMIQDAMEETRRIMANLRPSILDDLGILPTITWLCREFQKMNPSIDPVIKFEISEEDIPAHIKTVIFRLLQEALNNMRKYGRADRVEISLRRIGSLILFRIGDNGQGFNPKKVLSGKKIGHGFGLRGMLERVELAGGKCDVKSAPGKGVSICAEWSI
jgi:PAS domain S-box-containing protein